MCEGAHGRSKDTEASSRALLRERGEWDRERKREKEKESDRDRAASPFVQTMQGEDDPSQGPASHAHA